jgi:hypothetical protein
LWMDFLVNWFYQGLNLFPTSRWYKIMPREGLTFFYFFLISYARFWTRMNMTTHKTRAHVRRCGVPL